MNPLIMGLIFVGVSLLDSTAKWIFGNNESLEAKKEKERQKAAQLKMMDLTYEQEAKKANKAADQSDVESDFTEIMLGNQHNGVLDQLGLGQEAKTLEYNKAAISNGSNTGAGYQQLSTSGTRNSSSKQAVEMQANLNEDFLQAQQDIDRNQDLLTLAGALNAMQQGTFDLQKKRTAANDLRDAYVEGGDAYTMYQQNRKNVEAGYNYQIGAMQRDFNFQQYTNALDLTSNAINSYTVGMDMYDRYDASKKLWKETF